MGFVVCPRNGVRGAWFNRDVPVVHRSQDPRFEAWRARVESYARAVMGVEPRFDEAELHDGFQVGDTPAEYCTAVLGMAEDCIASRR